MADEENQDTEGNSDTPNQNEADNPENNNPNPPKKGFKHYWSKSVKGVKDTWNTSTNIKRKVDRKLYGTSPFWFFIICLFIHLYDISTRFSEASARLAMYIVLAIIAWVVVFKSEGGVLDVLDLKTPLILSTIAFVIPYLGNVLPFLQSSQAYQTVIIFFPVWILYLVFVIDGTKFLRFMQFVIIAIMLLLFLPSFIVNISADLQLRDIQTGINVQETIADGSRDMLQNLNMFWGNLKVIPGQLWNEVFIKPMRYATGDYYTGTVDEYEHEPVGVYLEGLAAADPKFFEGEKIIVWAVLKAKTLDNEININVSCYAKEGDKKINGNITPKNEFNIAGEEEEYLDCVFDKLNPGKKNVIFNAEFNFETMAYLKTYFMDKERLRAFDRDEIDVFNHYKISYRNPIAIYTNGPVGIGMRTQDKLPVGVYSNQDNIPFFFGITIENNWEGIIKNVTNLEVQVHDSLELTNCDHEFEFKEINEDNYNVYSLVPDKRTENIETGKFHSIQCRLNPADPKSLLGNEPITTRYFKVTANYIYELEKSTPVEIEEVKDYVSPEEAMTSEQETQEFKDKLNEEVDGKTNKDLACEKIKECGDYDANDYDKLGFSDQVWCDDNPCKLDCYSFFKKSDEEFYYDSCKECPYYTTIQGMPSEDYCNTYLTEDYCEKDSCWFVYYDIECNWYDNKCITKTTVVEEEEVPITCPDYITIQGMPSEDYCNTYLSEDHCEKDSCDFKSQGIECNWYDNKCVMSMI